MFDVLSLCVDNFIDHIFPGLVGIEDTDSMVGWTGMF